MKKFIAILLGIVIFLFGLGLGVLYGQQQTRQSAYNKYNQLVSVLRSKLIRTIPLSGTIQIVSNDQITVASKETAVPVLITAATKISVIDTRTNHSQTSGAPGTAADLIAGRTVIVTSTMNEAGQFEANTIQVILQ